MLLCSCTPIHKKFENPIHKTKTKVNCLCKSCTVIKNHALSECCFNLLTSSAKPLIKLSYLDCTHPQCTINLCISELTTCKKQLNSSQDRRHRQYLILLVILLSKIIKRTTLLRISFKSISHYHFLKVVDKSLSLS